ncbi:MAG: hypothetical protein HYZ87_03190, partial [Candidatus Omnitrophica bacterium]|nr:hypothetical protein [Candidatus Omnitrophota bacterium]
MKKRTLLILAACALAVFFVQSRMEVPVLMYHHVGSGEETSSLNVSLKTFERQMEFLKGHGYRVLPLTEVIEKIKTKAWVAPNI